MECVICKNGTTYHGYVTYTLERENAIVIFKNASALVCENCGEYYFSEETTRMMLEKASLSLDKGVEIEVINLNTAA